MNTIQGAVIKGGDGVRYLTTAHRTHVHDAYRIARGAGHDRQQARAYILAVFYMWHGAVPATVGTL
jgi:hypothetical protein